MSLGNDSHRWVVTFDGGATPNPGRGSCAYRAENRSGYAHEDSWAMDGERRSNNEAEWEAAVQGLEWVVAHDEEAEKITIAGDSELVIKQMMGMYTVKSPKLRSYYRRFVRLCEETSARVKFVHIPRELNGAMDTACKNAR